MAKEVWEYWANFIPKNNCASFRAGLAFLLYDLGRLDEANSEIVTIIHDERLILGMNRRKKTSLAQRYTSLFAHVD
jgi:hypothetical protein